MKNIIFTLIIGCAFFGRNFAQHTYLKVTLSEEEYHNVSFPPGTKFELKDKNEKLVYRDKDSASTYVVNDKHTLTVYPNWKATTDVFHITKGKLEQVGTRLFGINKSLKRKKSKTKKHLYDKDKYSNGITLKKTLEVSKENPNLFNATFEFSNGITAIYTDGEFKAKQNGKDLAVGYKYFIYSNLGIVKLSFRPKNGETWWVFEPFKD